MRALAILASVLALSGCGSFQHIDSDAFDPGRASYEHFVVDSRVCAANAEQYLSYDIAGLAQTRYYRNRSYNQIYAGCMTDHGYRPRSWLQIEEPAGLGTDS